MYTVTNNLIVKRFMIIERIQNFEHENNCHQEEKANDSVTVALHGDRILWLSSRYSVVSSAIPCDLRTPSNLKHSQSQETPANHLTLQRME